MDFIFVPLSLGRDRAYQLPPLYLVMADIRVEQRLRLSKGSRAQVNHRAKVLEIECGRHSSVALSAPTILRPRVQIPSTPTTLFSICII